MKPADQADVMFQPSGYHVPRGPIICRRVPPDSHNMPAHGPKPLESAPKDKSQILRLRLREGPLTRLSGEGWEKDALAVQRFPPQVGCYILPDAREGPFRHSSKRLSVTQCPPTTRAPVLPSTPGSTSRKPETGSRFTSTPAQLPPPEGSCVSSYRRPHSKEMMRAAQPTAVRLIVVEDPSRGWTAASRTPARLVGWQRTRT